MKFLYYLVLIPLSKLPEGARKSFSSFISFLLFRVFGYRKKMMESNLTICFPEKDEHWRRKVIKGFYENLGEVISESIQSFTISNSRAEKRIHSVNPEVLNDLFDSGRSVILTGGHYVNWEAITLMGNRMKHDVYALYKPLKNGFMNEKVQKSREKFGTKMISIRDYRRHFVELQSKPKLFIFGIDQSPRKGKGIWMEFLNRETSVFTGPERLAKEFDMAVVLGRMSRQSSGRYQLKYELLTDDPRSTETNQITVDTNRDLETQVREDPTGWLWSHNRWKHKKDG